jgi:hypothetical protein
VDNQEGIRDIQWLTLHVWRSWFLRFIWCIRSDRFHSRHNASGCGTRLCLEPWDSSNWVWGDFCQIDYKFIIRIG